MQVGVGVVDITPELGIWMSGYGGRSVATSVNDPLELQAVVMEGDNGTLAAIIASDLIGYDYDLVAEVRGELSRRHGLGPDAVMLNASHTHGGPAIINHLVVEAPHLDPAYRQRVVEAVYQAVGTALDNRQPAEPHHAWGRCTIGINRRQPGPPYAMAPNPKGFYDDTVGVLAFLEPGSGKPLAVLFNASCHPTTLGSQPIISADWPGAAKRAIESWLGEGGHALFLQAACGNIRPRTFDPGSNRFRQGTVEEFTRMGYACAQEVIHLLSDGLQPAGGEVRVSRVPCELPLEKQPTLADMQAMAASDDAFNKAFAIWTLARCPDGHVPTTLPYEAQLFTLGNEVSVLALPGEVVSELGYAARQTVPRPTLFSGYSNGLPCYVPNARIRRQGGYEAGLRSNEFFGLPGWLAQESELAILAAVEQACGQ